MVGDELSIVIDEELCRKIRLYIIEGPVLMGDDVDMTIEYMKKISEMLLARMIFNCVLFNLMKGNQL